MFLKIKLIYEKSDFYYVDHAIETKDFIDYIYEDKNHLINFIFSGNSVIFTGNDNDDDGYVDANSEDIPENCTVFEKYN